MPAERTVNCTSCGRERTTRAGAGTKLTCPGCRATYRAPALPEATADKPAPAGPPPGPSGVTVVRATGTKVTQRARPRTGGPKPAKSTKAPPPPPPPEPTPAKLSGRRGGLALAYRERLRARAGH